MDAYTLVGVATEPLTVLSLLDLCLSTSSWVQKAGTKLPRGVLYNCCSLQDFALPSLPHSFQAFAAVMMSGSSKGASRYARGTCISEPCV